MLQGVGVSPGVGIGRAVVIAEGSLDYTQVHFAGVQQEKARLRTAVQAFAQRTQAMADALRARLDGQEADILASQILMANDPALLAQTDSRIEAGECAEAALDAVCASYIQLFAAAGDELLAQRAADIEDIRARLLAILLGRSEASIPDVPPGTVLVAWDLTPSMTVSVNRENVAAFVAECGGMTSHAAILARALGLPAILGAAGAASVLRSGEDVVVDGGQGAVIVSPSGAELARYRKKQEEEKRQAEALQAYRAGPAVSARGQRYALYANIGGVGQTVAADEAGAEGVGLLRTEFLFMGRTSLPTEEEQYEAYASVSRAMGDRPAVVRTLDIGGDKALPYLGQEKEENPYLGRRGIRYCLARPEVFRTQLRALLRAGAERGNIRLMLPMVTGVQELRAARTMLEQEKQALSARGVAFDGAISLGVMIETPAAAVIADLLAKEADFFSIGTNDLVQYILAADRGNADIAELYAPCHPAVLRSIRDVIAAGRAADVPVCMCGEAAADPCLIPLWMAFGLDSFSAGPSALPEVRRTVSRWTEEEALCTAKEALACPDADAVRALLAAFTLVGVAKGTTLNTSSALIAAHARERTKCMNLIHACFATGSLLCPLFIAALGMGGLPWWAPMAGLALCGAALWGVFALAGLPGRTGDGARVKNDWSFLRSPRFWVLTGLVFFQNCTEISVTGWMVTYFKDVGILSGPAGQMTVTVIWGAMLAGRLCIAFVFPVKNSFRTLSLMSACCVGTYILLLMAKTPASALICLFLFGLAIAGVNPTAVAAGNALSGAGLGVMLPAAGVGAVLMPYITGAVAQRFGIWAGMLCTVFALMGMTACAVALHRRNDMK